MKNLIKILSILLLSMFIITGCADSDSNSNKIENSDDTGNGETGDSGTGNGNTGNSNTGNIGTGESGQKHVGVTGVEIIGGPKLELQVGEPYQLQYKIIPENATNKNVRFEPMSDFYIDIDSSGLIMPKIVEGSQTFVNIITDDGEFIDTVEVVVVDNTKVTGVEIIHDSNMFLQMGDTYQLKYKVTPETAINKNVRFEITDSYADVIDIDDFGKITVKTNNRFTTYIKIITEEGGYEDIVAINIREVVVTGIKITDPPSNVLYLKENEIKEIKYIIEPENALNKYVDWSVDNDSIVEIIEPGKIRAYSSFKNEETFIRVKTYDGNYEASIKVIVVHEALEFQEVDFKEIKYMGGLSYGIGANEKLYMWGNTGDIFRSDNNAPKEINFTITDLIEKEYNGKTFYYLAIDNGFYKYHFLWDDSMNSYNYVSKPTCVLHGLSNEPNTPNKVKDLIITTNDTNYYDNYTYYVLTDKGLYAWGDNEYGQVGNGKNDSKVDFPGDASNKLVAGNIKDIFIRGNLEKATYYVVTDDGFYAWGDNEYGQVGSGSKSQKVLTPEKVNNIEGEIKEFVTNISPINGDGNGNVATVHVVTDKGLYSWGWNGGGNVGIGKDKRIVSTPYKLFGEDLKSVIFKYKGWYATIYAITNNDIYIWGNNESGQTGNGKHYKDDNGTYTYVYTPYKVEGIEGEIKNIIPISSSKYTTERITVYAITDKGLYAWGDNLYGLIGNGSDGNVSNTSSDRYGNIEKPYKIENIEGNVLDVIGGTTVYVLTDKDLYVWGSNRYGQVGNGEGDGRIINVSKPYKLETIKGTILEVKAVMSSDDVKDVHTVYVLTDDGLYAWGDNVFGQVGNGYDGVDISGQLKKYISEPYKINLIDGKIEKLTISSNDIGTATTVYVTTTMGLYIWGYNKYGQTGNGNVREVNLIPNLAVKGSVKDIITRGSIDNATYYVSTDNGLYIWGNNYGGNVGNGTNNSSEKVLTPYKAVEGDIKNLIIYTDGSNRAYHYVITDNGLYIKLYMESRYKKIEGIIGDIEDLFISGYLHNGTYYVNTDDGFYAWGYNSYGQVGNGTRDDVSTPYKLQEIEGEIKKFIPDATYILTDNGLYGWGKIKIYNQYEYKPTKITVYEIKQ